MTELIWEGKYKDGKKVAPVRIALPFHTIETVNESAQERQRSLDLFASGREPEWRNRLIWGDKKYVLPSLLPKFAGKVNLIYKDRAATLWCENASVLTGKPWRYLKVPQKDFEKLQPESLAEVAVLGAT